MLNTRNGHRKKKKFHNTGNACVNLRFLQKMLLNAEKQRFCSCTRYRVVSRQASYIREMRRTHLYPPKLETEPEMLGIPLCRLRVMLVSRPTTELFD